MNSTAVDISVNVDRRHMTAGQRAMARAFARPQPLDRDGKPLTRGKKSAEETSSLFSDKRVQQARYILLHSPTKAEAIFAGSLHFDDVLLEVQAEQRALQAERDKINGLREMAPDLADRVTEAM